MSQFVELGPPALFLLRGNFRHIEVVINVEEWSKVLCSSFFWPEKTGRKETGMTIIEREFHANDKQAADQIEQIIQQEIIWWDWNCVRKTETEVVLYERMYSDSFELDDKDDSFFRKLVPYLVKGWITIYQ